MSYKRSSDIKCHLCDYTCGGTYIIVHIKKKHNLSKEEYLTMFPEAKLYTEDYYKIMQKKGKIAMINNWNNLEYKNKMIKVLQNNANNDIFKQKRIEAIKKLNIKEYMNKPEIKKKLSESQKKAWNNPNIRNNRIIAIRNSPNRFKSKETKLKISKSISNLWEQGIYDNQYRTLDKIFSFGKRYNYINKKNNLLHLASLQELRTAYLLDLCNINYKYGCKNIQTFQYKDIDGKIHKYIPDFQYKDIFIEVKPNKWQLNSKVYNKLFLVQYQNNINLTIYDDELLQDYMPKISRHKFYSIINNLIDDDVIKYNDIYNEIGDVRNESIF